MLIKSKCPTIQKKTITIIKVKNQIILLRPIFFKFIKNLVTRYTKKGNKTVVSIKTHESLKKTHMNCSTLGKTSSRFLSPSRDYEI